jgi:hypothetical protein
MSQFATILEYLERLKAGILDLLSKLEASPYYDRLLNRFETLEARHQKWIVSGGRLLVLALVAYFLVSPFVGLWSEKNKLDSQRALLAEMKIFNEKVETQPRPATLPPDWQPLAASTPEEASNSLKGYLSTIGLPDGSYQFLTSSNSHLKLDIPELNLRQAQAILYQIDGWYPTVASQVLSIKVHPQDEQKLTMSVTLAHRGGAFEAGMDGSGGAPSNGGGRRRSPRNMNQGGGGDSSSGMPSDSYSGGFDSAIPSSRPSNPNAFDESSSETNLPDFESLENNEALDSLPPPPPIEDEFGDSE